MHYLILQQPIGHKLVGFSELVMDLHRELIDLKRASAMPVIYSHNIYLCDDFGLPIERTAGWCAWKTSRAFSS
ncbi:hypothetical protein [Azotobacter beijerinckii]|nr:hypothetical protein [Azotobacter beijerinckii]